MELIYFVNLIFIIALNALFFFSGICLNSLVIVSFWRSVQLRKKLCYFMIMVLSCCDLLVVLTIHPFTILGTILWLTDVEELNVYLRSIYDSLRSSSVFVAFSLNALVVMSYDRYLATSYPIFHQTSVTKTKLSTLFAILNIVSIIVFSLSFKDFVISVEISILIGFNIHFPPILVLNYKTFMIAKKSRRNNEISPSSKKSFSLKNTSSCVLAVACFVVQFIPVLAYVGLRQFSNEDEPTLNDTNLTGMWAITISSMNSTFNCLIFYWKNKILRSEGMRVFKSIKVYRKDQSGSGKHVLNREDNDGKMKNRGEIYLSKNRQGGKQISTLDVKTV